MILGALPQLMVATKESRGSAPILGRWLAPPAAAESKFLSYAVNGCSSHRVEVPWKELFVHLSSAGRQRL